MLRRDARMGEQLAHRGSDVRRPLDQYLRHVVEALGRINPVDRQLDEPAIVRSGKCAYRAADAHGATEARRITRCNKAASTTARGRVSSQLPTISRTIPHRIEDARSAAPTPTNPPSIV